MPNFSFDTFTAFSYQCVLPVRELAEGNDPAYKRVLDYIFQYAYNKASGVYSGEANWDVYRAHTEPIRAMISKLIEFTPGLAQSWQWIDDSMRGKMMLAWMSNINVNNAELGVSQEKLQAVAMQLAREYDREHLMEKARNVDVVAIEQAWLAVQTNATAADRAWMAALHGAFCLFSVASAEWMAVTEAWMAVHPEKMDQYLAKWKTGADWLTQCAIQNAVRAQPQVAPLCQRVYQEIKASNGQIQLTPPVQSSPEIQRNMDGWAETFRKREHQQTASSAPSTPSIPSVSSTLSFPAAPTTPAAPDLPPELIAQALQIAKKSPSPKWVAAELVKYGIPKQQAAEAAKHIYRIKQKQTRLQGIVYFIGGLILLAGSSLLLWALWNNESLRIKAWGYALAGFFIGGSAVIAGLWKMLAG
jgi:hypothetical protein